MKFNSGASGDWIQTLKLMVRSYRSATALELLAKLVMYKLK